MPSIFFDKKIAQNRENFFVQLFIKLVLTNWAEVWYNGVRAKPARLRGDKKRGLNVFSALKRKSY